MLTSTQQVPGGLREVLYLAVGLELVFPPWLLAGGALRGCYARPLKSWDHAITATKFNGRDSVSLQSSNGHPCLQYVLRWQKAGVA